MSKAVCSWFEWSSLSVMLLAAAVADRTVQGQSAPSIRVGGVEMSGIPEDWSHRYIAFSDPGTEQEATQSGRYAQWQRIVNEPRYVMHQLKRNAPVQGPAAADVAFRSWWLSHATGPRTPLDTPEESGLLNSFGAHVSRRIQSSPIQVDWSQGLGGPGLATGHFPAKYSISTTTASCTDYVVFPTGVAGSSTHATIVAFNNLYVGTGGCQASNPTVYWAYNTTPTGSSTGAIANLSPVLSLDGTQVAFIQTVSSVAELVVLKMANSGGSVGAPVTPTFVTEINYRACNAPCFTFTRLNNGGNDTNSAPFYRYDGSDTLYVGDDTGRLHQFTGVFAGTPTETTANGWPASLPNGGKLTSPVYDSGGSTLVFVSDSTNTGCPTNIATCGHLNSVTITGTSRTVVVSNALDCGTGFLDPPLVDSTTENVYAFIGSGCDVVPSIGNSYINRFVAGTPLTSPGFGQNYVSFGNGSNGTNTNTLSTIGRAGAFDNLYFAGSTQGHVYACVNGRIYQISMPALNGTGTVTPTTFSTPVSTISSTSPCSPITTFRGAKGLPTTLTVALPATQGQATLTVASTAGMALNDYLQVDSEIMSVISFTATTVLVNRNQLGTTPVAHAVGTTVQDIVDRLFVSVAANGNGTGCTGACVYNYDITTGPASAGQPLAGLAASGGTSGIIIDNQSATQTGAQRVYFTTRINPSNAVQASQSNLQ
jgi:hypothetical protein